MECKETKVADEFGSQEWFEHFQKMWNPMNFPFPGVVQPTLDPKEIERKIADLKAVESWLKTNVGMIEMTIKTMEMQKSALETMQEAAQKNAAAAPSGKGGKKGKP